MKTLCNLLSKPDPSIKYKRIVFLGITNKKYSMEYLISAGQNGFDLPLNGIYPCLLQWETMDGEKQYAELKKINN